MASSGSQILGIERRLDKRLFLERTTEEHVYGPGTGNGARRRPAYSRSERDAFTKPKQNAAVRIEQLQDTFARYDGGVLPRVGWQHPAYNSRIVLEMNAGPIGELRLYDVAYSANTEAERVETGTQIR
jgi:hypothetical protein